MSFIADLHIHSRYSLATSADLAPSTLWRFGQLKGIRLLGTGDFTHPAWLEELEKSLHPAEDGFFTLRPELATLPVPKRCAGEISFLLSAEISCVYRKNERTRKVHCLVLVPDFASAYRLNGRLSRIGNLSSNGRPVLKLDAKELLGMVLECSPQALFIPAHAWTPHYSVFGAASGFDSLSDCFEELTPYVRAIETGLSSDPAMNRRLSALDGITLISNSDAHSPMKLGREATIFDTEISYPGVFRGIWDGGGVASTIEFFPQQGKYHADGHRPCGLSLSPAQTVAEGYRCPCCGKKVTIGVLHRVEQLADRPSPAEGDSRFRSVIPLIDLIAAGLQVGCGTKKALSCYFELLERVGNEFYVLLEAPVEEIARASSQRLAQAIDRMRRQEVQIEAGYDGVFGKVSVF